MRSLVKVKTLSSSMLRRTLMSLMMVSVEVDASGGGRLMMVGKMVKT